MTGYVPRDREPYKKKGIFEQKEAELLHALRNNFTQKKLHRAVEKVRKAKLGVLKGQRHCAQVYRIEDDNSERQQHLMKIDEAFNKWSMMSPEDIINMYRDNI